MQATNSASLTTQARDGLAVELGEALRAHAAPSGGWAYYAGKTSRLEPTSWALLASPALDAPKLDSHLRFLGRSARPDGLLVDAPGAPPNYEHNALVLLTLLHRFPDADPRLVSGLVRALIAAAGVRVPIAPTDGQDNMLQGWSWIEDTFSWAEPTSWCLLALKRAAGSARSIGVAERIDQAERLLANRSCPSGGWNYGSASMLGQSLVAYVPTTAVALLAMQDRRELETVARGLEFLEEHALSEESGLALSLALICLRAYDKPTAAVEAALLAQWRRTGFLGNLCTIAMARCAVAPDPASAFRLTA